MRKIFIALGLICVALGVWGDIFLKSPDGNLKVSFALTFSSTLSKRIVISSSYTVNVSAKRFTILRGTLAD